MHKIGFTLFLNFDLAKRGASAPLAPPGCALGSTIVEGVDTIIQISQEQQKLSSWLSNRLQMLRAIVIILEDAHNSVTKNLIITGFDLIGIWPHRRSPTWKSWNCLFCVIRNPNNPDKSISQQYQYRFYFCLKKIRNEK